MSNVAEESSRVKVEDAVRAAVRALPSFLGGRAPDGVRVEEVFPPQGITGWRITLSHLEPGVETPRPPLLSVVEGRYLETPPAPVRVFHVLEVKRVDG